MMSGNAWRAKHCEAKYTILWCILLFGIFFRLLKCRLVLVDKRFISKILRLLFQEAEAIQPKHERESKEHEDESDPSLPSKITG